ncbi:MAG: bifunctional anthranilate synthase component II/anthranilate phosphoribosyltransferase, partial [Treponemataceae bacterium]|nr:bifunctional anthranilate synthase component II/anthranilate phosphoribosyltransferase [Treponemataceae bacterium]
LNPAGAEYEVLGVYSPALLEDYARAAKSLGAKRVMVVASRDGFDEISPCVPTDVFQINEDGKAYRYTIEPEKYGITNMRADELAGGSGAENAAIAREVLDGGGRTAIKAAVALNAGAVLYISGKARTIKDGYEKAAAAIENGTARAKLADIIRASEALA